MQERRDLEVELATMQAQPPTLGGLEKEFVKVAKAYSEARRSRTARGASSASRRRLKKAGITRGADAGAARAQLPKRVSEVGRGEHRRIEDAAAFELGSDARPPRSSRQRRRDRPRSRTPTTASSASQQRRTRGRGVLDRRPRGPDGIERPRDRGRRPRDPSPPCGPRSARLPVASATAHRRPAPAHARRGRRPRRTS